MPTHAPIVAFAVSLTLLPVGGALSAAPLSARPAVAPISSLQSPLAAPHSLFGVIRSLSGPQLTLQLRTGRTVRVDATTALQQHESAVLIVLRAVQVRGAYDAAGVFHAQTILRAKASPSLWQLDR